MRLWENKSLKISFFTKFPQIWAETDDFKVSRNVYDIISERINMLKLVPVNKKLKNKLKATQYIQFNIYTVPYSIDNFSTHKRFNMIDPKFKKNNDIVLIDLMFPFIQHDSFIQYGENNYTYTQIFLNNLEIAVVEGLNKLSIYNEYISQTFNEIRNGVKNICVK